MVVLGALGRTAICRGAKAMAVEGGTAICRGMERGRNGDLP